MDVKTLAGTLRSGRRNALAGLLAGAAALLGRTVDTEAGKRRCPRCPRAHLLPLHRAVTMARLPLRP